MKGSRFTQYSVVRWVYSHIYFVLILLFLFSTFPLFSQITFIIESLPNSTPEEDSIFICGTFNNWDVNDNQYRLHKQLDGKYAITLPIPHEHFEYKFTRGSWMKVETNTQNEYIPNRIYSSKNGELIEVTIKNWQDLGGAKHFKYIILYFAL